MGEIKGLESALLSNLANHVGKYGFETKPRGQSFYKKTPFGRLAFHIAFIRHSTDIDVTADVAVRFDELEDLLNQYRAQLSKAEKKNTFSLGAERGHISEGVQKRWTVASLDDVEPVAESLMKAFESIGVPYLDRYSDMNTALEVLSRDDEEAQLHSPIHSPRASRAIGLAFLSGDSDRFHRLAATKTEFLASRNDFGLNAFLELKNELERRLENSSG